MPPAKKIKVMGTEEFRVYAVRYKIEFDGPVPPSKWPDQYKPLFLVIREIWGNRYDDWREKMKDVDKRLLDERVDRIRTFRRRVADLRKEGMALTEGDWRARLEGLLTQRFQDKTVWFVPIPNSQPSQAHWVQATIARTRSIRSQIMWHSRTIQLLENS